MKRKATRCKYGYRHWFTLYGWVGVRTPTCQRCGDPNPNITDEQREEYEGLMRHLREDRWLAKNR